MSRSFIKTVLAATLVVTSLSVAAPARAGDREELQALIAALGIAGTILVLKNEKDKRDKARKKDRKAQAHIAPRAAGEHGRVPQIIGKQQQPRYAKLPNQCLREVTGAKTRFVMPRRCLERNYASARPLPTRCTIDVRTANGKLRSMYSVRCLRSRGYRVQGWNER